MASHSIPRGPSSNRRGSTNDFLLRENEELKRKIKWMEKEMESLRRKALNTSVWRTPSPEEERFLRETAKRGLDDLVAQVVDGSKKRKVGGSFDPEKEEEKSLPYMVKVGGVRWEDGIGGVEAALQEAGVEFCEGTRWLVNEEELEKRRKRGSLASTVVVRVRGLDVVHQLGRAGVWVGGYWCSVKRFVAVQPKRKVWKGRDGAILASLKGLGDRMVKLEGMVNGVGRGVWRKEVKREVVLEEDRERKERQRMEEGSDSEGEEYRREQKKETGLSVFAKPFVYEPKGKKVDFGGRPPSPRGSGLIWSWEKNGLR